MSERNLISLAPGWALGSDRLQWILYGIGPSGRPYPVYFIATHKRTIERLIREEGIDLTPEGRKVIRHTGMDKDQTGGLTFGGSKRAVLRLPLCRVPDRQIPLFFPLNINRLKIEIAHT